MGTQSPDGETASHRLGRTLRQHCEGGTDVDQPIANGPRLLAVLRDCHDPRSGDVIVYEWVMRQQGFLALARPAPDTSRTARELSVLALVEDAGTLFNTQALQRIRAFLEGYLASELPLAKADSDVMADEESEQSLPSIPQASRQQGRPQTRADEAEQRPSIPHSSNEEERDNLFMAALTVANAKGVIAAKEEPSIQRSGPYMNFFRFLSESGRLLALVDLDAVRQQALISRPEGPQGLT